MFRGSGFHLRITPSSSFSNDRPGHGGPQLVAGIAGALIAIDAKDGTVGSSRFHGLTPIRARSNPARVLASSHWGGACNREMSSCFHAFTFVNRGIFMSVERICARGWPWKTSVLYVSEHGQTRAAAMVFWTRGAHAA